MVLGLSGDEWTALGSLAALLGLLLSAWSLRRRSDNAPVQMTPEASGVTPTAEKLDWPPDVRLNPAPSSIHLRRTDSGSSLLDIIGSAAMYQLDHDEPATAEEADRIADAFSSIHNWAETGEEVDPGDRVRASFELTELLEELGKVGWSVYAATTPRKLVVADKAVAWPIATIHIARTKQAEAA